MSGGIRQSAGLIKKRLERYLQQITIPDFNADFSQQLQLLEQQKSQIQCAVNQLSKLEEDWIKLFPNLNEEDAEREMNLMQAAQEGAGFLARLEQAREQLVILDGYILQLQTLAAQAETHNENSSPPSMPSMELRLPKIELRKFDGNSSRWPVFWDWYQATIDSQMLSDSDKLAYFSSCMQGPAKQLVEAYQLQNASYKDVVDRVRKRYANKDVIVQKLYDELESLSKVQEGRHLRKFVEEMERILELLANQGEDISSRLIQRQIEKKLPRWILMDLEKTKLQHPTWNITSLREFLANLALAQEAVSRTMEPKEVSRGSVEQREKRRQSSANLETNPMSSAFSAVTKSPNVKQCAFCDSNHWSSECSTYKSVAERKQRCGELQKCYRCLRRGHFTFACRNTTLCYYCKGRHNQALCPAREQRRNITPEAVSQRGERSNQRSRAFTNSNTQSRQSNAPWRKTQKEQNNLILHANAEDSPMSKEEGMSQQASQSNVQTITSASVTNGAPEGSILLWSTEITVRNPRNSRRMTALAFFD